MKISRLLLISLIVLLTALEAIASTWPPQSPGAIDSIEMRIAVIKGLPDSVKQRNMEVFTEKVDEDEYNIYQIDQHLVSFHILTRMLEVVQSEPTKHKSFVKVVFYNDKGEPIRKVTSSEWGVARIEFGEGELPDGVYRLSVDYGKKHSEEGTKPKERVSLKVSPSSTPPGPTIVLTREDML